MPDIRKNVTVTTTTETYIQGDEVERLLCEALGIPAGANFEWSAGCDYVGPVTIRHQETRDGSAD